MKTQVMRPTHRKQEDKTLILQQVTKKGINNGYLTFISFRRLWINKKGVTKFTGTILSG